MSSSKISPRHASSHREQELAQQICRLADSIESTARKTSNNLRGTIAHRGKSHFDPARPALVLIEYHADAAARLRLQSPTNCSHQVIFREESDLAEALAEI